MSAHVLSEDEHGDATDPSEIFSPDGKIWIKKALDLTPLYADVEPVSMSRELCKRPIPFYHPIFQVNEFLTFNFTTLNNSTISANAKELVEAQLTQAALVAALLVT